MAICLGWVKDPYTSHIKGASSLKCEENNRKRALILFSGVAALLAQEEPASHIYTLLCTNISYAHKRFSNLNDSMKLHFAAGAGSPRGKPAELNAKGLRSPPARPPLTPPLPRLPAAAHEFIAPECPVLTHLPCVHLKPIIIKEKVWSNSIQLLSQKTAVFGSQDLPCWVRSVVHGVWFSAWGNGLHLTLQSKAKINP